MCSSDLERQPLVPVLWQRPLTDGPATVVNDGVAVGPAPAAADWAVLASRGVRAAATTAPVPNGVTALAAKTGIELVTLGDSSPQALERLRSGGPWYVWGVPADAVRAAGIK